MELYRRGKIVSTRAPVIASLNFITYCFRPLVGGTLWTSTQRTNWTHTGQNAVSVFHTSLPCHRLATMIHFQKNHPYHRALYNEANIHWACVKHVPASAYSSEVMKRGGNCSVIRGCGITHRKYGAAVFFYLERSICAVFFFF